MTLRCSANRAAFCERVPPKCGRTSAHTPAALLHIHQIDINIHEEAGGRFPEDGVLMNGMHGRAGVRVCLSQMRGGRGAATVIKSQPPLRLLPHQPPVAPVNMLRLHACLQFDKDACDACVYLCVCVRTLTNSHGLALIKRSGLAAKLTTRHTNSQPLSLISIRG